MAVITRRDRNFEHAMYTKRETEVGVVTNSAGNYLMISKYMTVKREDEPMDCFESLQMVQVCFGGPRLSCLVFTRLFYNSPDL